MTTSSSPSAAITPLAEQSTLEEDYFADLLLDDDPDEVVLPKSRENRMNRAFQDSKTIYRKSDALTEPGWHPGLKQDPRIRRDPDSSIRQTFDTKMADSSMVQLYHTRSYRPCLDLCLAWIATNSTETSASAKETMDTAMRAAIALGDKESCLKVADITRRWWKLNGNSAVTHTAARALSIAGQYRDSVIAMLFAIAERGVHLPFLVEIESALVSWRLEEKDTDMSAALDSLLPSVKRCKRTAEVVLGPRLFSGSRPVQVVEEEQLRGKEIDDWPHIPLDAECASVGYKLRLDEAEIEALGKFCRKILAIKDWERMRMKDGGVDVDGDLRDQGRSVRTL